MSCVWWWLAIGRELPRTPNSIAKQPLGSFVMQAGYELPMTFWFFNQVIVNSHYSIPNQCAKRSMREAPWRSGSCTYGSVGFFSGSAGKVPSAFEFRYFKNAVMMPMIAKISMGASLLAAYDIFEASQAASQVGYLRQQERDPTLGSAHAQLQSAWPTKPTRCAKPPEHGNPWP